MKPASKNLITALTLLIVLAACETTALMSDFVDTGVQYGFAETDAEREPVLRNGAVKALKNQRDKAVAKIKARVDAGEMDSVDAALLIEAADTAIELFAAETDDERKAVLRARALKAILALTNKLRA